MPELLSLDARGDVYLTMPPAEMINARLVAPEVFAVGFGRHTADVDVSWVIHAQHVLTVALCEAGYGAECATPESLARMGGAV